MRRYTKTSKFAAASLTAVLAAGMLAGCGSGQGSTTESTTADSASVSSAAETSETTASETSAAESGDTPVLTVAFMENEKGEYSGKNYAINWIEQQMGVKLEFVALPSDFGDAETKLNLMLSSGDYPDIICYSMDKQKMVKFGQEGIFIPLNDYFEKDGTNLKAIFEKRPQYEKLAYAPDGNMYGFISINECYHCQAYPKLWYNSEWLDSLGLKEPTTTDELKDVLMAVKNSDYNGNGKADEIALTGSPDWDCQAEWWLMNCFEPCDKTTLCHLEDGKVVFSCNTDNFRKGLEYMNDLYENGLLDPTMFSQSSDQMQQVIRSDNKLVFAYAADHFGMGIDLNDAHLNEITHAMLPVKSETGAQYQLHNDYVDMTSGFTWFITDACKDPELAFKVGDFLLGDECSMVQMYGEEGKYWGKLDTPEKSIMDGVDAVYWVDPAYTSIDNDDYNKNTWWTGLYDQLAEFRASMSPVPDDMYAASSYEARLYQETEKVVPYFYPEYLPKDIFFEDQDNSEQFATLQTSLQEYVKTSMAQFITGEMDIEKDWDSYVQTLNDYGVDQYVQLYQSAYDEYNAG